MGKPTQEKEERFQELLEVARCQLATQESEEMERARLVYVAACRGMVEAAEADIFTKSKALAEMERATVQVRTIIENNRNKPTGTKSN